MHYRIFVGISVISVIDLSHSLTSSAKETVRAGLWNTSSQSLRNAAHATAQGGLPMKDKC